MTMAKVTQHAPNFVEDWCEDNQDLSANLKRAEAMLITRKRKLKLSYIFGGNFQYRKSLKYLGIYIDSKLTWSTHITFARKTQEALSTLWICNSAISHTWGLSSKQCYSSHLSGGLPSKSLPILVKLLK